LHRNNPSMEEAYDKLIKITDELIKKQKGSKL